MFLSSNRWLLTTNLFLQTLLLGTIASSVAAQQTPAKLPNIVLLYADDMGYGDLGVQNPESKIPTPNLDRLAKSGTRFTDAHSSSGICTPAAMPCYMAVTIGASSTRLSIPSTPPCSIPSERRCPNC